MVEYAGLVEWNNLSIKQQSHKTIIFQCVGTRMKAIDSCGSHLTGGELDSSYAMPWFWAKRELQNPIQKTSNHFSPVINHRREKSLE